MKKIFLEKEIKLMINSINLYDMNIIFLIQALFIRRGKK